MKAYIKDLRSLNSDSVFHLYVNDVTVHLVQSLLYTNKIPEDRYTITVLSDGTHSYSMFRSVYGGANPTATHGALIEKWKSAKKYAYKYGEIKPSMTAVAARNHAWAIVDSKADAQWWLTRPALLESPGDGGVFGAAVAAKTAKVKQINIGTNLTAIKGAGDVALKEFKSLFKFNDTYFAKSTAAARKVMMFLGTALPESDFEDYARFTMKYYGSGYDYYYKGHPRTPTGLSKSKQDQLRRLGVTDVESSVPAELILFFNPDIYMSGYTSSTYASVSDPNMAKGLFAKTKAQGLAITSEDYSEMAWFMAPRASYSGAIAALPGDFVVEFADKITATKNYDIALWNSAKRSITYYAVNGATYTPVTPN